MKRKNVCWIGNVATVVVCAVIGTVVILLSHKDDDGQSLDPPEVQVSEGVLRGLWLPVPDEKLVFAAFRGIPYAAPPNGTLRFKAPKPPSPGDGKRDATKEGANCWQPSQSSPGVVVGSEDCLYLNVYTPSLPDQKQTLRPVYFFIHGGGFIQGSGDHDVYGPEFLMLQDIVVVTINYRLGVFGTRKWLEIQASGKRFKIGGIENPYLQPLPRCRTGNKLFVFESKLTDRFLSLDNEVVPGNAGIKDQIAALQWVRRNIAQFGGDPSQITVGGQSGGAMSSHWLTILPESRDLIKRVIMESGTALHTYAYTEENLDVAKELGHYLTNRTISLDELATLVMSRPAKEIIDASISLVNRRRFKKPSQLPYAPTPERRTPITGGEKLLITKSPELYIIDPNFVPKPMFVGMNNRELLTFFYSFGPFINESFIVTNLIDYVPKDVIPYQDEIEYLNLTDVLPTYNWPDVTDAIDDFFFRGNDQTCNLTCTILKFLDDSYFGVPTNRLVELRVRNNLSTTYVYRFSLRDEYSLSPLVLPEQSQGAAIHSDELGYIWKVGGMNQTLRGDTLASLTLLRMTNMWGSFVKTGIPSPDGNFTWRPSEKRKSEIIFLEIEKQQKELKLEEKEENLAGSNMPFWLNLYQRYRQKGMVVNKAS